MDDYINPLAQYITTQQQMQARSQQTDQERQASALIEALRAPTAAQQMGGGGGGGNVVSATSNGSGLAQGAQMGAQLGQLGSGLYKQYKVGQSDAFNAANPTPAAMEAAGGFAL